MQNKKAKAAPADAHLRSMLIFSVAGPDTSYGLGLVLPLSGWRIWRHG